MYRQQLGRQQTLLVFVSKKKKRKKGLVAEVVMLASSCFFIFIILDSVLFEVQTKSLLKAVRNAHFAPTHCFSFILFVTYLTKDV